MWNKIEHGMFKIQEAFIAIALAIIMFAVLLQIIGRLAGWHSLGMPEYTAIGMTIITFIGAGAITYTREYIAIELGQMVKNQKFKQILTIIVDCIVIAFTIVFLPIVYNFLSFALQSGEKTLEVGIPVWITFGFIVLGITLMLIHSVSNLIRGFINLKNM